MKLRIPLLIFIFSLIGAAPALAQKVPCVNDFTGCTNGTISPGGSSGASGANPTATATGTAINGSASTFMRSDAAPAIRTAATGAVGLAAPANPSATAGPNANNGSAVTFMRSDASPAVQLGSTGQKGIVQADGTTLSAASGVLSVTNPVGAPTVSGGYTYMALPNGYYYEWGGLNSAGSGVATVVFPYSFTSGISSSGATTGQASTVVWGPAACTGPPVTICSWTVTDLSGTPTAGTPVYWWAIGH